MQDRPSRARRSIVGHLENILRPLRIGSLTTMTVEKGGPLRERWSVIEIRRLTLGENFETLRNRVSDNHDG